MSCWTHVAAVIRLDALIGNESRAKKQRAKIRELLGKTCLYEDDMSVWEDADKHPESYLPMGSEGSLKMTIHTNPEKHCLAAYVVTIFGDLRDCGYSKEELEKNYIEWFKEKLRNLDQWFVIRQASITTTNGLDTISYTYKEGDIEE